MLALLLQSWLLLTLSLLGLLALVVVGQWVVRRVRRALVTRTGHLEPVRAGT